MKIQKVTEDNSKGTIVFEVHLEPSWYNFLGVPEVRRFIDSGSNYMSGGGRVYVDENGDKLLNGDCMGKAIDKFIFRKENKEYFE